MFSLKRVTFSVTARLVLAVDLKAPSYEELANFADKLVVFSGQLFAHHSGSLKGLFKKGLKKHYFYPHFLDKRPPPTYPHWRIL